LKGNLSTTKDFSSVPKPALCRFEENSIKLICGWVFKTQLVKKTSSCNEGQANREVAKPNQIISLYSKNGATGRIGNN
jgi:hypothetical protein